MSIATTASRSHFAGRPVAEASGDPVPGGEALVGAWRAGASAARRGEGRLGPMDFMA